MHFEIAQFMAKQCLGQGPQSTKIINQIFRNKLIAFHVHLFPLRNQLKLHDIPIRNEGK